MKRRTFLWTTLLTTIGGCTGSSDETTPTERTEESTVTPSPSVDQRDRTPTPNENPPSFKPIDQRKVTLEGEPLDELRIDILPDAVPFTGNVKLSEQPVTSEQGVLCVEMSNRDNRPWVLMTPVAEPFAPVRSEEDIIVSETPSRRSKAGCARGGAGSDDGFSRRKYSQDEQSSGERYVYVHAGSSTCYATGKHTFRNDYEVYDNLNADRPRLEFRWGFTFIIK